LLRQNQLARIHHCPPENHTQARERLFMDTIEKILPYKGKIERGGKEVRIIAEDLRKERSIEESEQLAQTLFAHSEVGVKMVGVFLFGILASQKDGILLLHC
jgi:hypothetical protein